MAKMHINTAIADAVPAKALVGAAKALPCIPQAFVQEFGQFLIQANLLDEPTLARASRAAETASERLDRVLVKLGLLSEADLAIALAKYLNIPLVKKERLPIEPLLTDLLDADFIRHNRILPLYDSGQILQIGAVDPFSRELLHSVGYLCDREIALQLFTAAQFEKAFESLYDERISDPSKEITNANANDLDVQRLRDLASEAPTIRLVNLLIADAVERLSSDIHIEPTVDALVVRYRIDGVLYTAKTLDANQRSAITSRIKIMSGLDIAERRLPQDGRTKIALRGIDIDFRVSTIPTIFGESIVLRILDRSRVQLEFDALGFQNDHISAIRTSIGEPDGIVLITGPTGSGKTTTLYTALKSLNSTERKIFTVEDPVEYQLVGINQVQVQPSIGLSFPTALRSILRQDPDIIMIGEIRDLETARIAVQASLTGHLVLSTVHTNSASATIARLIDMGVENYLLTSTLKAVVAQRLVRKLCPHCSQPHPESDYWIGQFRSILGRMKLERAPDIRQKHGCGECGQTGFSGRSTIAEVLILDTNIRRLILKSSSDIEIAAQAQEDGMITMYETGVGKVVRGETTIDEVLRATRAA